MVAAHCLAAAVVVGWALVVGAAVVVAATVVVVAATVVVVAATVVVVAATVVGWAVVLVGSSCSFSCCCHDGITQIGPTTGWSTVQCPNTFHER